MKLRKYRTPINLVTRLINVSRPSCSPVLSLQLSLFYRARGTWEGEKYIFTIEWTNERDWISQENPSNPNRFVTKSKLNFSKNCPRRFNTANFHHSTIANRITLLEIRISFDERRQIDRSDATKREIETWSRRWLMKRRKVLVTGHR